MAGCNGVLKLWIGRPRRFDGGRNRSIRQFVSQRARHGRDGAVGGAGAGMPGRMPVGAGPAGENLAAAVVLVALTALSRPVLGVHYFSDVLAGVAGGLAWTLWLADMATGTEIGLNQVLLM